VVLRLKGEVLKWVGVCKYGKRRHYQGKYGKKINTTEEGGRRANSRKCNQDKKGEFKLTIGGQIAARKSGQEVILQSTEYSRQMMQHGTGGRKKIRHDEGGGARARVGAERVDSGLLSTHR